MNEYLQNLAVWDWLAFAALLLIVEVFGTAGYFLWFGTAAAMVGLLLLAFPELSWVWQFIAFAPVIIERRADLVAALTPTACGCVRLKSTWQ